MKTMSGLKWAVLVGCLAALFVIGGWSRAAAYEVHTETRINPAWEGILDIVPSLPPAGDGRFQACEETVSGYDDFKLAVLRAMRRKATGFTICFAAGYRPTGSELGAWWDRISPDQDVPWLSYTWTDANWEYYTSGGAVTEATFAVEYMYSRSQEEDLEAAARDTVRSLMTAGTDMPTREMAIHDWVARHVTYDQSYERHSDYDAYFSYSAVCQGYALLTSRLLSMAGIENRYVSGEGNGEPHAWNLVKLCGSWFHLDVTWDDPIGMPADYVRYDYYNRRDGLMDDDHWWDSAGYPAATTTWTDYFCAGEVEGTCGIFTPQACHTELSCINIGGDWNGASCSVDGSDPSGNDDPVLAAPATALNALDYGQSANPAAIPVSVPAGPILLQPTMTVKAGDGGRSASLFIYLYMPAIGAGFNFYAPAPQTLGGVADYASVFPRSIDLSGYQGLVFDVYCGYALGDGTIRYHVYRVTVQ
ncbi:MAG: hypothetical protein JW781_06430 [Deltaproteobacteria bacterium]|nr:hypothetical protein [Candidatus Anaeroferrophillacea bacterium]